MPSQVINEATRCTSGRAMVSQRRREGQARLLTYAGGKTGGSDLFGFCADVR